MPRRALQRERPTVVWLHSLARSGSSITVYAAAAPWQHAVADEIIGPWDRTGAPYWYPRSQRRLVRLFKQRGHELTPDVVDLTNRVLSQIAGTTGVVISKWPHLRPAPEVFDRAFPNDRRAYLIRNPLHRLNSLYRRGWLGSISAEHDFHRYAQFARWWREQEHRLTYDELRADPRAFFSRLFDAWGWDHDQTHVEGAVAYMRQNYHASSAEKSDASGGGVLSEREFALPEEAIDRYLSDPFMVDFMQEMGWSTDPADYGATARETV